MTSRLKHGPGGEMSEIRTRDAHTKIAVVGVAAKEFRPLTSITILPVTVAAAAGLRRRMRSLLRAAVDVIATKLMARIDVEVDTAASTIVRVRDAVIVLTLVREPTIKLFIAAYCSLKNENPCCME